MTTGNISTSKAHGHSLVRVTGAAVMSTCIRKRLQRNTTPLRSRALPEQLSVHSFLEIPKERLDISFKLTVFQKLYHFWMFMNDI